MPIKSIIFVYMNPCTNDINTILMLMLRSRRSVRHPITIKTLHTLKEPRGKMASFHLPKRHGVYGCMSVCLLSMCVCFLNVYTLTQRHISLCIRNDKSTWKGQLQVRRSWTDLVVIKLTVFQKNHQRQLSGIHQCTTIIIAIMHKVL